MMKSGTIKHKLRQVVYRHRKRFVEEGLKRRPSNCAYNGLVRSPQKGPKKVVRLCLYKVEDPDEWNNVICDENFEGGHPAGECPHFKCANSARDLKAMFASLLGLDGTKVDIGWVAKHYPDVAALTWVLGEQPKGGPEEEVMRDRMVSCGQDGEPDHIPDEPLVEDDGDE